MTLTFADSGPVAVRHGFILVPMDSVIERVQAEFDLTGLGQTRLQQVGSFVGIENPSSFIETSKKLAAKLRREMDDDESWQSVVPTTPSIHLDGNKSLRSQNGYQCYKGLYESCFANCSRKVLSIVDWSTGVGDRAVGALQAHTDSNACPNNPSVYYSGFSTSNVMVDTTRARLRQSIGDQYVRGVLTVEDRVPVVAPAANASVATFPLMSSKVC